MLNPVELPLPVAAAAIALMAIMVALGAFLARSGDWEPWPTWAPATSPTATLQTGRHRLDTVINPYRPSPWPADRPPFVGANVPAHLEEVRKQDGNGMWSWSDANWAGDTRELAATR